ncbi:MAG: ATP-dependent DNA helicase [bacterium]
MEKPDSTIFEKEYSKLNVKQKEAVDNLEGPVMVIAGPGSGKTQVLTLRIANILKQTQVFPSNILCLTFTESATYEMKSRLNKMIGQTSYDVNIFTFHSFCSYVIKSYPDYFTDLSNFEVISDVERLKITISILEKNEFNNIKTFNSPFFFAKEIIRRISELKKEGIDSISFKVLIDKVNINWDKKKLNSSKGTNKSDINDEQRRIDKLNEMVKFYSIYEEELKKAKKYDFDDMINAVLKTVSMEEDLALSLQERYQYILVDEYQDTNTAQNKIIGLLTKYWTDQGDNPNIFVVGDDDQSIFRFQGASLENILYFRKKFPKTNVIVLDKNYRSNSTIVETARKLIDTNSFQLSDVDKSIVKKFDSAQSDKPKYIENEIIKLVEFEEGELESYYIASKAKELIAKGIDSSEIAVIFKENNDAYPLMEAFQALNVPFTIDAGENILNSELIVKILKLLEVINDPYDDIKFFTTASYDFLGISQLDLLMLSNYSNNYFRKNKVEKPLFDIITTENLYSETKIKNPEKLTWFTNKLVEWAKLSQNTKLSDFFSHIIREAGVIDLILVDNKNMESSINIKNLNVINTFYEEIKKAEKLSEEYSLKSFLADITLLKDFEFSIKEKENPLKNEGVKLMTAHRSKGLQFGYVFIYGLVDKKWSNKVDRVSIKFPNNLVKMALEENTSVSFEVSKEEKEEAKKMRLEDDRRVLYVAMTRAKHQIYLTYSLKYKQNSSEKSRLPTVFLSEIENSISKVDPKEMLENLRNLAGAKIVFQDLDRNIPTIDEGVFIDSILTKFKMNATSLNNYLKCGYKFKLNNVLRLPRTRSLLIGSLVHKALELFFKEYKQTNALPSLDKLIEIFLKLCKEEYISKSDYKAIKTEGESLLEKYYTEYKESFKKPLEIEYNFGYKNVYFDDIPLSGKIDKIELIKEPSNHTEKPIVRIVDYKSGKPKSDNEIEGNTKNSDGDYKRQLLFYKLLSENDRNFEYEVNEAELDFLKDDKGKFKKYVFTYADLNRVEELKELKVQIKNSWKDIKDHKFERTKDFSNCESCEYKDHCFPGGTPS